MSECVTPELWRIGEFVVTDCAGSWPLLPELFPPFLVAFAGLCIAVGYAVSVAMSESF